MIVSCGELGVTHGANLAIYEALGSKVGASASLVVPAPWSRGAAAAYRGEDVGVALTLNAEHDLYRWGPITQAPSLLDGDGGFPRTVADVFDHADLDEVRRETRAQLERAIYWGFDVSHLATHLEGLELRPEFFDVVVELAEEFVLPLRLADTSFERLAGFPFRSLSSERGVLSPDRVIHLSGRDAPLGDLVAESIETFEQGVTELCLCPAIDTPELRAVSANWQVRVAHHEGLAPGGAVDAILQAASITRIGYRRLRTAMRTG